MAKLQRSADRFVWWCPACDVPHVFNTGWTFDGNAEAPTISPSIKTEWNEGGGPKVCHVVITKGQIFFCDDCTHGLKGQTVPLPEIPAWLDNHGSES